MLNHDTGQMDWRDPSSASTNNGYLNPNNVYDQMTHVGREALYDAPRPVTAEHAEVEDTRYAKAFFVAILVFMLVACFIIPGRS